MTGVPSALGKSSAPLSWLLSVEEGSVLSVEEGSVGEWFALSVGEGATDC